MVTVQEMKNRIEAHRNYQNELDKAIRDIDSKYKTVIHEYDELFEIAKKNFEEAYTLGLIEFDGCLNYPLEKKEWSRWDWIKKVSFVDDKENTVEFHIERDGGDYTESFHPKISDRIIYDWDKFKDEMICKLKAQVIERRKNVIEQLKKEQIEAEKKIQELTEETK